MELKRFFVVLISMLSFVSFAGNRECQFYLVDFNKQHLACLKQHIATKSIGKNLSQLRELKKTCPDCKSPSFQTADFFDLAGKKYLAMGIKEQPLGGFSILVLFENEPHVRQLWLYPIETSKFQLRDVKIIKFSKKFTRQILKDSKDPKYVKYWQNSSS